MAGKDLAELLVSSEVQTARDRLDDYDAAELAAVANPHGDQELEDLREALVDMPDAVRMLLEGITWPVGVQESRSTNPATAQVYHA